MENIAEHDNLDSSISLGAPSFPQLQVETENTENNKTNYYWINSINLYFFLRKVIKL